MKKEEGFPGQINFVIPERKATFYSRFACQALSIERIKASRINDRIELFSEIFRNLDRGFSLEGLEYVNLSLPHFSRLFLTRTGHSAIDYFIQLKVQRACRLLDNSGWMIADVAREMGFDDQFYFSRVFRKVMGMSPAEYRKRGA